MSDINWDALRAAFKPNEIEFRIQATFEKDGKTQAVVAAYLDARAVMNRLDEVCGPEGWSFDWQPVVTDAKSVQAAKGTLTIGGISKSDVGDAGDTEPTKASVSGALKRAAVMWGIGRYLYDLPVMYAAVEQRGKSKVLPKSEEERLRQRYLGGQQQQPPTDDEPRPIRQTQPVPRRADGATSQRPVAASVPETGGPMNRQPAQVADLAARPTSKQQQMDIIRELQQAGYQSVQAKEQFLAETLGRPIDFAVLGRGQADLTIAELQQVLAGLEQGA